MQPEVQTEQNGWQNDFHSFASFKFELLLPKCRRFCVGQTLYTIQIVEFVSKIRCFTRLGTTLYLLATCKCRTRIFFYFFNFLPGYTL